MSVRDRRFNFPYSSFRPMYFLLNQFAKLFLAFFPFFPRKLKTYARVYIFECNTQLHTMVEEILLDFEKN